MTDGQYEVPLATAHHTQQLGQSLGQGLPAGSVILLRGDLGAGKTTLVQGIGDGLGINEPIVSPTFTLINEYLEGRLPLYHLDLYRLAPVEVAQLYLEQYWLGQDYPLGLTAIEWADRLPQTPEQWLAIELYPLNAGRGAKLISPWLDLRPILTNFFSSH
jgi:tRNA threonylcarbamoyladenosine biosynthesis protein TsaE